MDTLAVKKHLKKHYPMMISPVAFAFALAACGGGGDGQVDAEVSKSNENIKPDSDPSDGSNISVVTILGTEDTLNLGASSLAPKQDILRGLHFQPAATAFSEDKNGVEYAYVFPTLFSEDPQLPGLEYIRSNKNEPWKLSKVLDDVTMGSGRDYEPLSSRATEEPRFVIVDHGSEYSAGRETWPFGFVWVATATDDGFQFDKISNVAAFNHSVAVGDVNADGLEDILVINMGTKDKNSAANNLHLFEQQKDGSFVRNVEFASEHEGVWGSGAVAISDFIEGGDDEIIVSNYRPAPDSTRDWGAFRIFSKNDAGTYVISHEIPRQGLFETMGSTKIVDFDYDQDGDLDFVVSLEGEFVTEAGATGRGHALQIYQNLGNGKFELATNDLLVDNIWPNDGVRFREFEVLDINGDDYPDIVLNGWSNLYEGSKINLSNLILVNNEGTSFSHLTDDQGNEVYADNVSVRYLRAVGVDDGSLNFFGMQPDATPLSISIDII